MKFIREAIPHGDSSILRQNIHILLGKAALLDTIIHAAKHARGVLHALLVANMRASGADKGDVGTLVERGDLKGTARARGILLKDERDILAFEALCLDASIFSSFEVRRKLQQEVISRGVKSKSLRRCQFLRLKAMIFLLIVKLLHSEIHSYIFLQAYGLLR